MAALDIQIGIESGDWPPEPVLDALCARVFGAAADHLAHFEKQPFAKTPSELSLVFTDDASVRAINAQWRGIDTPTNVLSFPAFPLSPGKAPGPMLGDIVLAQETVAREAAASGLPFKAHLTHLLVHGFLHLFGYDHLEETDAQRMEALETGILTGLGLSDPYRDSDPA